MALGKEFNHTLPKFLYWMRSIPTFHWVCIRIKWDNKKTLGKVFSEIQALNFFSKIKDTCWHSKLVSLPRMTINSMMTGTVSPSLLYSKCLTKKFKYLLNEWAKPAKCSNEQTKSTQQILAQIKMSLTLFGHLSQVLLLPQVLLRINYPSQLPTEHSPPK